MADQVITDAKVWVDGYDFSGDNNAVALNYGAELVDDTKMGGTTRVNKGGLFTLNANLEGMVNVADDGQDEQYQTFVGVADKAVTISHDGEVDGSFAYSMRALLAKLERGAAEGELLKFSVSIEASAGSLIKSTIMHAPTTARVASGNGTARQLGAVSATQRLYATLHVLTAGTGTLDVIIQSDNGVGMATPATVLTFAQKTAIGSESLSVAGAITDDYFRVNYTIGGGAPSFKFLVTIGIK